LLRSGRVGELVEGPYPGERVNFSEIVNDYLVLPIQEGQKPLHYRLNLSVGRLVSLIDHLLFEIIYIKLEFMEVAVLQ
jgi:hypothetical protein